MEVYNYSNQSIVVHKEIKDYLLGILAKVDKYDFEKTMNEILLKASATRKIDSSRVIAWLKTIDFTTINLPLAYIKKAFNNELEKGAFDKNTKAVVINSASLFEGLRKQRIIVLPEDTIYIDILLNTLAEIGFTIHEIDKLNHQIVNHIIKNGGGTTTDFIAFYQKAKLLKGKKEFWQLVKTRAESETAELDYILKGLDHLGLIVN